MTRTHTAQELFRFAKTSPGIQAGLGRTFATLAKYRERQELDTDRACHLLHKNNVREAAKYYVQHHGLELQWWRVFPLCEREGCAALMLRQFDAWYALADSNDGRGYENGPDHETDFHYHRLGRD